MTDEERAHQIDVLSLILGATIGALQRLGYFTVEEVSKLHCIVTREEASHERNPAAPTDDHPPAAELSADHPGIDAASE